VQVVAAATSITAAMAALSVFYDAVIYDSSTKRAMFTF
jgi:hypothetical protein